MEPGPCKDCGKPTKNLWYCEDCIDKPENKETPTIHIQGPTTSK